MRALLLAALLSLVSQETEAKVVRYRKEQRNGHPFTAEEEREWIGAVARAAALKATIKRSP
ncbi:MAG: hypothetical protein M3373_03220 [Gemmatimonadota bacterium]|nr:hypothetical protein [Gemmatimonadota bacterium]